MDYIEIPRRVSKPVKIDAILDQRLKRFTQKRARRRHKEKKA